MKRIFLALLVLVALFGITTLEQWFLMTPTARAQVNTFCAANLACTVTGVWAFTSASNVNNTLYISQFAGADLGAKMNAAVTNCTVTLGLASCRYIIDISGAISTAPNFPMGSIVECTATNQITLSTTWTIAHRNTTFFFNGCQFNYNLDVGGSAFYIGKNTSGTVNTQNAATGGCAGNCATFATGTNFANIDQYDVVYINAAVYNVCSVQSATVLTLCAPPGTQTGVTYGARLTNSLIAGAPYPASVTIRDLNVTYTGAGTTTSIGVNNVLANQVDAENIRVYNFTGGQSVGWNMLGAEDYTVYKLILSSNKCQMVLDQGTIGGLNVATSMNRFVLPLLQNGGACTSPTTAAVTIQNSSFGNEFSQPDLEGNTSTYTFNILLSSFKNIIEGADFETNGDSTAGSIDVLIQSGTGNIVKDSRFTSLAVNKPATGLFCSGVGVFCTFTNDTWGPASAYTTAWNFSGSSVGLIQANQPGAAAHGDPVNTQDNLGNYSLNSVTSVGAVKPSVAGAADVGQAALPWGNLWLGTAATNNFKLQPAATAAARVISMPDPLGAVNMPYVIANGTSTLTTTSTATLTCQTTVTTAAANALTTDSIEIAYSSAPTAATDGLMIVQKWVTAGNVNFMRCNPTAGTLVPTALVINWRVIR